MDLTEDDIVELAGLRGRAGPIVSCYLDVDGRSHVRPDDYERELEHLLRRARRSADKSVEADLDRIERFVKDDFERGGTRGLAVFSAVADDVWRVVELPVPVRSHVVVNPAPAVKHLESIVQQHEPIAVLLVDRQQTRLFEFELGTLVERTETVDELPRDYDERGASERGGVDHHVDALVQQHVKASADAAFELFKRRPFRHLVVGGAAEVVPQVEAQLHPYLAERLCGRVEVGASAPLDAVRDAVLSLDEELERQRADTRVHELKEAIGADRGVAGLDPVLEALHQQRVTRLLVSDGYADRGWECGGCGRLAEVGRSCPSCGDEMSSVADVVEEAVEVALRRGCGVEVCAANADLDVLGRIGAVLHY